MKMQNRRIFFRNITIGAIGFSLLNTLPGKLFAGAKKQELKQTANRVKIHNKAVKRSR